MTAMTTGLTAAVAGLALFYLAANPAGSARESVGVTTNVRNIATISVPPGAAQRLAVRATVHVGDFISTGARSAVGVKLADQTLFSIGANARVGIDAFVYDPSRSASRVSLSFLKGAFRFVSGKSTHAYPGQEAIRTPAATIGIRGTVVTGVIGPEALAYYRQINPENAQSPADAETATLIILSDAGDGDAGLGGIDITAGGNVIALRKAGQALYFPRRGGDPAPPVMLDPQFRRMIERRAEPPGFERNFGPRQAPDARAPRQESGNGRQQPNGGQGGTPPNSGPAPAGPTGGMPGPGPGSGPPR